MTLSAPYIRNSDTSYAAALSMQHSLNRLEGIVLAFLRKCSTGATDEQIQERTGLSPNTARPRRVALVNKGLVRDSGQKRQTWAGRWATVWEAT